MIESNHSRIHFHHLPENLQDQLRRNALAHLIGPTFSIPIRRTKVSSPIQRSALLDRGPHLPFKYQTSLLHSSEPETFMQVIQELDTIKQSGTLNELFPSVISCSSIQSIINSLF